MCITSLIFNKFTPFFSVNDWEVVIFNLLFLSFCLFKRE